MDLEEVLKTIISVIVGGIMGSILYRNVDQEFIVI